MFKEKVLIPLSLRRKVLKQSYSNHPWTNTIKAIARGCAYWHGMAIDIEGIVKGCLKFQLAAKGRPGENLIPWPGTRKPWSPVDVDFTDPIKWATNSVMEDSHSNAQKLLKRRRQVPRLLTVSLIKYSLPMAYQKRLCQTTGHNSLLSNLMNTARAMQ